MAEIRTYNDLHNALRRRADELKVSRANLDELTGLPPGYAAKLLAPNPIKCLGRQSLGALLEVMGCKLVLELDPDAYARIRGRLESRSEHQVRAIGSIKRAPWLFSRKNARHIAAKAMQKLTPAERSLRARRAAVARWSKAD